MSYKDKIKLLQTSVSTSESFNHITPEDKKELLLFLDTLEDVLDIISEGVNHVK